MGEWLECTHAGKLCAESAEACVENTSPCEGRECLAFGAYPYCVQKWDCEKCLLRAAEARIAQAVAKLETLQGNTREVVTEQTLGEVVRALRGP